MVRGITLRAWTAEGETARIYIPSDQAREFVIQLVDYVDKIEEDQRKHEEQQRTARAELYSTLAREGLGD